MSDTIILAVKAKHFRQSVFSLPCCCEIAIAANDYFKCGFSSETINHLWVDPKWFEHKTYGRDQSKTNHALASAAGYDDTIIFNLELKEVV